MICPSTRPNAHRCDGSYTTRTNTLFVDEVVVSSSHVLPLQWALCGLATADVNHSTAVDGCLNRTTRSSAEVPNETFTLLTDFMTNFDAIRIEVHVQSYVDNTAE